LSPDLWNVSLPSALLVMPVCTLCFQPNNLPTDLSILLRQQYAQSPQWPGLCWWWLPCPSACTLLDLNAASDTVDHQIRPAVCVLSDCFDISGTAFNWFQFYLSKQTQSFVSASVDTDHLPVTCSVPQGSVFGPLGFIAYTDDLTAMSDKHAVYSHIYLGPQLYDSSTLADTESLWDRLTSCVSDVVKWCVHEDCRWMMTTQKWSAVWLAFQTSPDFNASTSHYKLDSVTSNQAVSSVILAY